MERIKLTHEITREWLSILAEGLQTLHKIIEPDGSVNLSRADDCHIALIKGWTPKFNKRTMVYQNIPVFYDGQWVFEQLAKLNDEGNMYIDRQEIDLHDDLAAALIAARKRTSTSE